MSSPGWEVFEKGFFATNVRTQLAPKSTHSFQWTIENISLIRHVEVIYPFGKRPFKFYLETRVSKFIFKFRAKSATLLCFTFLDTSGQIHYKGKPTTVNGRVNMAIDVFDTSDDIVIISCEIESSLPRENCIQGFSAASETTNGDLTKLSSDCRKLFDDAKYTDIILRVEDNTIPAHKAILCARSPVFAAMIKSKIKTKRKRKWSNRRLSPGVYFNPNPKILDVEDISFDTLKSLVIFFYTGAVDITDFQKLCLLYNAANNHDAYSLQQVCMERILFKLTPENVCQALKLAIEHEDLKDKALKFLKFSYNSVVRTKYWKSLVKTDISFAAKICYWLDQYEYENHLIE